MNIPYQLVVRKGPKPGQIFPLFSASTTIGRDPISDITINDPEISRQHARFTPTSDSYQIEDLGSTNGTFVNGVQIGTASVQLAHGNEIQLGSGVILIFELTPDEDEDEMGLGLETAVPPLPLEFEAEEPVTDPMLPPEFTDWDILENSAEPENPEDDMAAIAEELDALFAEENIPPPPPDIPPVVMPATAPPPRPAKDENPARRLVAIGAALILLMMCCCCGFLFFIYQWGGDWLLQQMGLLP